MQYRPDIDGLRAWAVMIVVIYHAGVEGLAGGFIGVDVFFVISGYLITGIIAKERAAGRFSIWRFYERRIRRIIPALAVVVVGVLAFGSFYVLPDSLERMSGSALAAMLFFANIHFWSQSANYFAPGSETDPFLHTWSLAVEEQFYLVFPLLFLLVAVRGRRAVTATLLLAGLASFALMLAAQTVAPTATFFLPVTRAWEFLAGSLLALNMVPKPRSAVMAGVGVLAGMGLILGSALLIDTTMPFPGWVTLGPVLGAMLLIQCGDVGTRPARLLLEAEPIRQVGLISYSLYLWHWPIFVLAEHFALGRPLVAVETAFCVALAFGLATLSYRYVEQPFRHSPALRLAPRMLAAAAPMAVLAVATPLAMSMTQGLTMRHPDFAQVLTLREPQRSQEQALLRAVTSSCFVDEVSGRRVFGCELTPAGRRTAMLWGDSFAHHYLEAMAERPERLGDRGLISFVTLQCPPVLGYDPVNLPACKKANDLALETVRDRGVDTVFLAANWFSYMMVNRITVTDVADTVARLRGIGVRVVLIGQSPIFDYTSPEEALFRERRRGGADAIGRAFNRVPADFNEELRQAATADLFFDPTGQVCTGDLCRFYDADGYVFWDYGHLSLVGARRVVAPLFHETNRALWERDH